MASSLHCISKFSDPARHARGAGEVSGWADDLRGGASQPRETVRSAL